MIRRLSVVFVLCNSLLSHGQSSFFAPSDTLNKKRFIWTSVGVGTAWGGTMIGLDALWYSQVPKSSFNTLNDNHHWLQMDKAGHFYTAYRLSALTTELYEWTGVQEKNALWYGIGVGVGFQTTLEVLDGFTEEWGWSWGDVAANTAGVVAYAAQKLIWKEERIIPKFSYSPTDFAEVRPEVLGENFAESIFKDYNGQTYWLSVSPGTFFKNSKIPKWACISFGYSAHEKLVGSEPTYVHPTTGYVYREQREFLFSLDIDFAKIPAKKPWVRTLLYSLGSLKMPFPALILRDGLVIGKPLYF